MNKAKLQLVKAAAVTFSKFGFKKTTMEDIAFSAGKGKSSLYYYFKNKEEVFEAVAEQEAAKLKNEINEALSSTTEPIEKLKLYITLRMNRFVSKGNLYTALNDNFLGTFSFIEKIRNQYRNYEIELISSILEKGIQTKDFKRLDTTFAATTLLTAMIGFEIPLLKDPESGIEFNKKIEQIINLLFYGICT